MSNNKLSDEEIDQIVLKVCDTIEDRLYHNVGHGVIRLAWRAVLIGLIVLAAYGAGIHFFK